MDKQKKFDDVPAGRSISYEHFLFYLEQGREIEFIYQDKEYFISHSPEGRAVWTGQKKLSDYFDDTSKDMLNSVKINGVTLADLVEQKEVKITTIF